MPRDVVTAPAKAEHPLAGARRVLVARLDNAGDVVLAGPTIRAIHEAVPGARITLLSSPVGADVASLLPWVSETIVLRAVWQDVGGHLPFDPARELAFVERLREGGFDAAVILTSFSQTPYPAAYACYLAGIPVRIGHSALFGGAVLSHPVPGPAPEHQAERNLHLLESIGVPVRDRDLAVIVPETARARARALSAELGIDQPPVLVVPGASCAARRYAPERFGAAAAELAGAMGVPVLVVGTEKERSIVETVAAVAGAPALVGRTGIAELAALVEASALVLANDSLALHLADALDRPVVATFAGTDREAEWGPRRAPAVLLREPTACAPCRRFECPYPGHPCLDIDPSEVAAAASGLLARSRATEEVACAV